MTRFMIRVEVRRSTLGIFRATSKLPDRQCVADRTSESAQVAT